MQDLTSSARLAHSPRLEGQQDGTKRFSSGSDRSDDTLEITIEISLRKGSKAVGVGGSACEETKQETPSLVAVTFTVNAWRLESSKSRVFVVGNIPQLGNWCYRNGFELQRSTKDGKREYSGTLKLHQSLAGKVEYKLVGANHGGSLWGFERAGGSNRVWTGEERVDIAWEP
ncbi:hypothetical protein JCM10296v2_006537 [Rhodotorula toruloides]